MTARTIRNSQKQVSIADRLSEAYRLLEAGSAGDALALIKQVKVAVPRNVFVLAFEKQVEQLIIYSQSGTLTEEQRVDIMESIPGIIERAIDGAAVEQLSAERTHPASPIDRDDKAAALEWLKDQYFQHAHEYVQKEEYEHALAEIRRVYIIDPGNKIAREFETRIEHLLSLKSPRKAALPPPAPPPPPPGPTLRLVTKESLETDAQLEHESTPVEEPAPVVQDKPDEVVIKTEEWSSPAVAPEVPSALIAPQPKRRGLSTAVTILLLIAVVALGATVYFLWARHQNVKRSEARRSAVISSSQPETFLGAPTLTEERNFVVSSPTNDSNNPTPQAEEIETPSKENPAPSQPDRSSRKEPAPKTTKVAETKTPVKTDPVKTDPVKTDPVKTDPVKTDPVKTDPVKTNPVKTAPEKTASEKPAVNPPPETTQKQQEQKPAEQAQLPPPIAEEAPPSTVTLEKAAEIIKLERIQFPESGSPESLEGQVIVQVQIDAGGKPIQTKVVQSTNILLVSPVVNAIMKSRFSPAQMSSGPVISWMTIPFKFKKQ